MTILKPNTSYINSWNMFSRSFLVKENLGEKNLIIFDKIEDLDIFAKIWNFLSFGNFTKVETQSDYLELINSPKWIYFCTRDLFNLWAVSEYELEKNTIILKRGTLYNPEDLIKNLIDYWFKYSAHLAGPGSYNREWDILNIRPKIWIYWAKISFFWDEVDEILEVDTDNVHNVKKLDNFYITNTNFIPQENKKTILDNLDQFSKNLKYLKTFLIWLDFYYWMNELIKNLNPVILSETPSTNNVDLGINSFSVATIQDLIETLKGKNTIKIYTKNEKTITNFLEYNNIAWNIEIIEIPPSMRYLESFIINNKFNPVIPLKKGIQEIWVTNWDTIVSQKTFLDSHFRGNDKIIEWQKTPLSTGGEGLGVRAKIYICDDVLSDIFVRKRSRKSLAKSLDLLLEIRPGDYIVHIDHWIGKFIGIILKDLSGIKREYIEIEYKENDKLFVPISELHRISKYIGNDNPTLTRLNSPEWQKVMKNTEVEVEKIAHELLEIYAKRNILTWFAFTSFPEKEAIFKESFQYKHTMDQTNSINEILSDMENTKPLDRLLVWDVWFGKTEVAMNAIYRSFLNGKQSALISPLVILAFEHYDSLRKRFADFWVRIEILTRVTTKKEESVILKKLAAGEIDCIIGTHRLLSPDVNFKNLGLIIIDEEHRFWVIDKEKLNLMKFGKSAIETGLNLRPVSNFPLDILSLSATPIPRSLNFALNWIKDISIIGTPPPKKQPIRTIVSKWNDEVITESIKKEFDRSGQVLFIHNRIATIDAIKHYLEKLIGKVAKIVIVNWQMNWIEVEDRIIDFKNGKYNILLSTTVIENWVNFINANTIIINDADTFWLSQLHQLRWRVGRWNTEGNCYLVYRKENLADDAKKRLITIVNNTHLGAGFEIAMRDLEIRWAGDILWIKQSGKSKDTWLSLYLKLLEDKIEELKTWVKLPWINCSIELGISYYISDDFFASESDKLHFFRNIESIETLEDLDFTHKTFIEWNDKVPEELENLFKILRVRIILSKYSVTSLKKIWQSYVFEFDKNTWVAKIREFLDLFDKTWDFVLVTVHKIKVETKIRSNDLDFLSSISL